MQCLIFWPFHGTNRQKNAIGLQRGHMPSVCKPCYRRFGASSYSCDESGVEKNGEGGLEEQTFYLSTNENRTGSTL